MRQEQERVGQQIMQTERRSTVLLLFQYLNLIVERNMKEYTNLAYEFFERIFLDTSIQVRSFNLIQDNKLVSKFNVLHGFEHLKIWTVGGED